MNAADSIVLYGNRIVLPYSIELEEGWNIMGYPQNNSKNAMQIVQAFIDKGSLIKVQDEQGNAIEDFGIYGGWQNFIGDFVPGEGYKIKLNSSTNLELSE
jgi:hypothetical protein